MTAQAGFAAVATLGEYSLAIKLKLDGTSHECAIVVDSLKSRMVPVKRFIFKGMFATLIRDAFDMGQRNAAINQAINHQTAGWKGLGLQEDINCLGPVRIMRSFNIGAAKPSRQRN